MFRPRILKNVDRVNISRTVLGTKSAAPFFISLTALVGLAHPDGELAFRRAAANENILQCISMSASFPLNSIVGAAPAEYPFFLQVYFDKDRLKTKAILNQARDLGVKAIFLIVDSPTVGKREADERAAHNYLVGRAQLDASDKIGGGFAKSLGSFIDKTVVWEDVAMIKRESGAKVALKGVQTVEDVKLAVDWGVDAVLLSNHGGRSLDGSQATVLRKLHPNFEIRWKSSKGGRVINFEIIIRGDLVGTRRWASRNRVLLNPYISVSQASRSSSQYPGPTP